jgi:hypothetical protein
MNTKIKCFVLVFTGLFAGTAFKVAAQADCEYRVLIDVRNEANDPITNANLRLSRRDVRYRPELRKYETLGLALPLERIRAKLKISVSGYRSLNHELILACPGYEYLIILRPKRSKLEAEVKVISKTE